MYGVAETIAVPPRRNDAAATRIAARKMIEETTLSQGEIARRLSLPTSTLSNWKRREGWVRPAGAPTLTAPAGPHVKRPEARRQKRVMRLYAIFERQMADLEARAGQVDRTTEEKDARALGTLARTLGTLIALERDDDASASEPEQPTFDDVRAKLAQRLFGVSQTGEDAR